MTTTTPDQFTAFDGNLQQTERVTHLRWTNPPPHNLKNKTREFFYSCLNCGGFMNEVVQFQSAPNGSVAQYLQLWIGLPTPPI